MDYTHLSGIEVKLQDQCNENRHFHPEIELLYVVTGELTVWLDNAEYQMKQNDILVINSNTSHQLQQKKEALFCDVSISYKVLSEAVRDGNYVFYCNSVSDSHMPYRELQALMKRVVLSFAGRKKKSDCLRHGLVFEVLDHMIEYFRDTSGGTVSLNRNSSDEQLQYILNYINMNFQEGVHLRRLAEEMYTSPSTLSRFFKKQTGVYFADFLNQVRLSYALRDLRETSKSITRIAADCGFSNPSVFSRIFQQEYGLSPSSYRKQESMKQEHTESAASWKQIQARLSELVREEQSVAEVSTSEISITAGEGTEYRKFWNQILNAGSAHNLVLANLQEHILILSEQLKFRYVRIWNIFSEKLMIQRNENDFNYNFNMIDHILDFLIAHDLKPFMEFGRRPETALAGEGDPVYYEEEYLCFPSAREWNNLFQAFFSHIVKRYGKEETETWIYEFNSDLRADKAMFGMDPKSMETVFPACYRLIRKSLPKAKIGGVGTVLDGNLEELVLQIREFQKQGCMPDFLSLLAFPYVSAVENGESLARRSASASFVEEKTAYVRERLDQEGLGSCLLFITEWNHTLSNRNFLNDSCFRGAYLVRSIGQLWGLPDLLGIWMGSDWISSYYDTVRIANGGSGLITKDGIRKPVFYAMSFLNRMGNRFLAKGEHYIATTDGNGSYYLLCHNCKNYHPSYFLAEEDSLDPSRLAELFEDQEHLELKVTLDHMADQMTYVVKKHVVNDEHGSILGQWQKFQFEKEMEGSDIRYLQDICVPDLSMEKKKVVHQKLTLDLELEPQSVVLVHIYEA